MQELKKESIVKELGIAKSHHCLMGIGFKRINCLDYHDAKRKLKKFQSQLSSLETNVIKAKSFFEDCMKIKNSFPELTPFMESLRDEPMTLQEACKVLEEIRLPMRKEIDKLRENRLTEEQFKELRFLLAGELVY